LQLQHHLQRVRGAASDLRRQEPAGRGPAVHRPQERLGQRRRLGATHRRSTRARLHTDGPVRLLVTTPCPSVRSTGGLAGRLFAWLLVLLPTAGAEAANRASHGRVPDVASLEAAVNDAFERYDPP